MEAVKRASRWAALFAIAVCATAGAARAAVEDCIPADAVAVLKVQDPVAAFGKFTGSALFRRLEDPTFIPQAAQGIAQVRQGIQAFETQQGVNVRQIMSDTLGREVAVVALPGNLNCMVAEGRDARSLQSGVDEFLRLQRMANDLTAESSSSYKGVTVYSGMQKKGERFHAISGNVLVAGEQLGAVQKVIDVIKGAPALGASADYRKAAAMAAPDAPVMAYLNGQALAPLAQALQAPPAMGQGDKPWDRMVRARIAQVLPLIQSVVLTAKGDGALHVQLTIAYRGGQLPDFIRAVLPGSGTRLDVLRLAPQSAVLAGARSLNLRAAWDSTAQSVAAVDPARAEQIQKWLDSVVGMVGGVYSRDQLFGELGSQVGLFVLPGSGPDAIPAAALALQLRDTTHIPDALGSIVGLSVGVARNEQGKDISMDTAAYKGVQLTTVRSGGTEPLARLSPTFAVVDDYLVVATAREAATQVVDAARSSTPAGINQPGTPFSALTLSVPQVRAMLGQYRGFLVKQAVAKEAKSPQQVQQELDALDKVLSLFQSLQVAATYQPGRTDHFLTVETSGSRP